MNLLITLKVLCSLWTLLGLLLYTDTECVYPHLKNHHSLLPTDTLYPDLQLNLVWMSDIMHTRLGMQKGKGGEDEVIKRELWVTAKGLSPEGGAQQIYQTVLLPLKWQVIPGSGTFTAKCSKVQEFHISSLWVDDYYSKLIGKMFHSSIFHMYPFRNRAGMAEAQPVCWMQNSNAM